MRSDVVEKRLVSFRDLSRQGKRINGLFRLLACPTLWERAYEEIAPNKGALTPGIDPDNTLDGFSLERVERIVAAVMDGTYRFAPVRRHYIPKTDGRQRPLGIPTADDKLVQAAVKIVLEHVFEPVFSDRSHGFRRGRSCHTALDQIKHGWAGVKWLVEVDVSGFFDNVDHDVLLDLLAERIDDERFLRLVGRMLKAGYMEDWTFHRTFSGTPQGGVISPILANIYLHALDERVAAMKAGFDKGKSRRRHPVGQALSREIEKRRSLIERRRSRGRVEDVPALLAEIRKLEQQRRTVPATDGLDPDFRRLLYCRYADDFLIGIIGSKADARTVMLDVQVFLSARLHLATSPEKSGIRKASEGASILGYSVRTHTSRRTARIRRGGRTAVARVSGDRVQLHAPREKLARFVERNRLGSYHSNQGAMRPERVNHSDLEILAGYNALMRGLAEYYKLGTSWRREIGQVFHVWWWSLIKTLGRKHKRSAAKVCSTLRTGEGMGLWYEGRAGTRRFMPVFTLKDVQAAPVLRTDVDREPSIAAFTGPTDTVDRLKARQCEACGAADVAVEVHHARRLDDVKHRNLQVRVKAARTRKRVILCVACHHAHHTGRLQERLDALERVVVGAG